MEPAVDLRVSLLLRDGGWIGYLLGHSKLLGPRERVRREQQCLPSAGVRAFSSQCLLSFYCLI